MENRTQMLVDLPKYDSLEQLAVDNGEWILYQFVTLVYMYIDRFSRISLSKTAAHLLTQSRSSFTS